MLTRILLIVLIIGLGSAECEFSIMSFGDFNLTSEKQLKDIIKKENVFLLGLTSGDCQGCCESENFYQTLMETLDKYRPRIPFIRHNLQKSNFISKYIPEQDKLPAIYGVKKGTFFKYHDMQDSLKILRFADRLISPVFYMKNLTEVLEYLNPATGGFNSLKLLAVLDDSDLKQDYEKSVEKLGNWFTTEIRAIIDRNLIKELRKIRPDIGYNTLILIRQDDTKMTDILATENLYKWILNNCVGLVEELTPYNFQMYSTTTIPMIILFLDPKNHYHNNYIEEYKKSARKFEGKIRYSWLDATKPDYIEKRRRLGLVTEILPSIAFNVRNQIIYPYPEGMEFIEKNIDTFAQGYIDGKKSNQPTFYTPKDINLLSCKNLKYDDFEDVVYEEGVDVVLFLYTSHNHKDSEKFSNVFNKVCEKFTDLGYKSLEVYVYDNAVEKPYKTLPTGKFPRVLISPAYSKNDPLVVFNGEFNVEKIMKFVEKNADVQVVIPDENEDNKENMQEIKALEDTDGEVKGKEEL
ncbi:hypothetical protein SteCoe_12649 [Stentor coeruleus]|uniref:protein disulfide-isomerase n=1 Tax=Stentor coeruleus TaxID=5963 RepID=A0A1R2CAB2_9CILI|nr:hypothetical protein SteCoe_12649 [Stentor coeruleus]